MELDLFKSLPAEFAVRYKPKAGTNYIFSWTNDKDKENWRADGYRWRQGGSKTNNGIKRKYFRILVAQDTVSDVFVRRAHYHADYANSVLISYIGDEAKAVQFPYGNATRCNRDFIRTQPGVINQIKESTGSVQKVYKDIILSNTADINITAVPRNMEQVSNTLKSTRNQQRLSRDSLYNLHELAYDTNFIHSIITFPDLVVVMYSDETLQIFQQVLKLSQLPQQLSYDTTFSLGDFYLSVLLFRETEIDPSPIIPLAFMIHERKTLMPHSIFWQHMKLVCPELALKNVFIVTDQERAITEAIKESFPSVSHFLCWNHVLQDSKRWLQLHGVKTKDELAYYTECIQSLLRSDSESSYKDKLITMLSAWSQPFSEYYIKTIHSVVDKLGSWRIKQFNFHEITTNQSEAFNTVIKRLQDWKEATVDSMALSLYRLIQYSMVEIYRARKGTGQYELRAELKGTYEECDLHIPDTTAPEQIVQLIKETINNQFMHNTSKSLELVQDTTMITSVERANEIIRNSHIALDPKLATFIVKGSIEPRVVKLFPKETCSCPAESRCYHILAARQAIGLSVTNNKKKQVNLTQLRRNTRKKSDKTGGRKRPRTLDIEVIPAGDANPDEIKDLIAKVNALKKT
ncbi:uncharacterized protein LOC124807179 [Hydra vulgaris]|uniref:uncharacterized protein LOC124807179 n=1 Tax=Hydra vulgaris TaxID=6087 RepID=UPI001F5F6CE0|nr:uncharacterized protein LOC124807179 [Hydra vulgaris]